MKMKKVKIGIFGCGNMGQALVLGMYATNPEAKFYLFTPSHTKAQHLATKVDGVFIKDLSEMPADLDWYLLGFKPQNLADFNFSFRPNAKIISVLAGVSSEILCDKFGVSKLARLMPNTPSAIGSGANLFFLNDSFSSLDIEEFKLLISSSGSSFSMHSEKDLDITTGFSSSGPALIFEIARIFEEELTRMTEGRVDAREIVLKTFLGSSLLMNDEKMKTTTFLELRNQVTSKKGVTFEALEVLAKNKLQEIFTNAFEAAYKRTVELSQTNLK
jgi:pyrroline-5-carboxylate reductase